MECPFPQALIQLRGTKGHQGGVSPYPEADSKPLCGTSDWLLVFTPQLTV